MPSLYQGGRTYGVAGWVSAFDVDQPAGLALAAALDARARVAAFACGAPAGIQLGAMRTCFGAVKSWAGFGHWNIELREYVKERGSTCPSHPSLPRSILESSTKVGFFINS